MDSSSFQSQLRAAASLPAQIARQRLPQVAAETLSLARQYCPVDTGALADSGTVENTVDGADVVFKAPYALAVHERLDATHTNGGPKFLERAFLEKSASVADNLRDGLEEALGNLA